VQVAEIANAIAVKSNTGAGAIANAASATLVSNVSLYAIYNNKIIHA
jgi:hypothetical protein